MVSTTFLLFPTASKVIKDGSAMSSNHVSDKQSDLGPIRRADQCPNLFHTRHEPWIRFLHSVGVYGSKHLFDH